MFIYLISQVGKTVGDMEFGVRPMPVGTVVVDRYKTTEVSYIIAIIQHIFLSVIRAIHDTGLCTAAFPLMVAGNNIHHPSHRIRAIHQRTGTTNNFYPFHIRSDISVRKGMSEDTCPLRLSIKQHQHLVTLAYSTDIHCPGRTIIHPEPGYPLLCHKQSRNALRKNR